VRFLKYINHVNNFGEVTRRVKSVGVETDMGSGGLKYL